EPEWACHLATTLPVLASHNRISASVSPEITREPSGKKATAVTSAGSSSVKLFLNPFVSQRMILWSAPPVASREPSPLNERQVTVDSCPSREWTRSPLSARQTNTFLSAPLATTYLPSGLKAAQVSGPSGPLSDCSCLPVK